jgi:hypothetical protein
MMSADIKIRGFLYFQCLADEIYDQILSTLRITDFIIFPEELADKIHLS